MNFIKLSKPIQLANFNAIKSRSFFNLSQKLNQASSESYGYLKEFKEFIDKKDNNHILKLKFKSSSEASSSGEIDNIEEIKVDKLKNLLNNNNYNNEDYRYKLENDDTITLYSKSGILNDLKKDTSELGNDKDVKLEDIQNDNNEFKPEKRLNKE